MSDKITTNDLKTKIDKNLQIAQKKGFHTIQLSVMSTVENKDNAFQIFFNWEKLSHGKLIPSTGTSVQVLQQGERVVFDNMKKFNEKNFTDIKTSILITQNFQVHTQQEKQEENQQLNEEGIFAKVDEVYEKIIKANQYSLENIASDKEYVYDEFGGKRLLKQIQLE